MAAEKKLLLHCCCAPCSAAIIEWLIANDIQPTLFFFNPNIFPKEEYEIRRAECIRYAKNVGIEFIEGDYNHEMWLRQTVDLASEPERGKRCLMCFKERLLRTAQLASEYGFTRFATTLAASRWKSLTQIAEAGAWAASQFPDISFWDKNWRKDGLQERRNILLQENGFYNQTFCGCEFSNNG